jgi:hypothetical protein
VEATEQKEEKSPANQYHDAGIRIKQYNDTTELGFFLFSSFCWVAFTAFSCKNFFD